MDNASDHMVPEPDQETPDARRKLSMRAKSVLSALGVATIILFAIWFVHHETRGKYLQETNDAQLKANATTVSPRISGYVSEVLVAENQDVRAGQPLVRVDPQNYRATQEQAQAQIAVAQASAENARASIQEQHATIEQSRAQLSAARAKATYDAAQVRRYEPLAASGAETRQQLALLQSTAAQSAAQVKAQAATVEAQSRRTKMIEAQVEQGEAQVEQGEAQARAGRAQLAAANMDVSATLIRAAVDGRIGDKTVTPGQYVQAGTRLMSIVPLGKLYVVANFKETQLALMRPGQPAVIKVDALAGTKLRGRVESIAPGTGAQFSLIPSNNATGNFTKIVQRVPVRISIQATRDARRLLVPGLSVTVEVDTFTAKNDLDRLQHEQEAQAR